MAKDKRKTGPLADPNVAYLLLDKVVNATRDKKKLSDRDQYQLPPGEHRLQGVLNFDISFSVGEDATAMRNYGVPLDAVILLALYHAGAMRQHFIRAALIVRELRTADLEERRIRGIRYVYQNENGHQEVIRVKASEVAHEGMRLGLKLAGEWPEMKDNPADAARRKSIAEQIAVLASQIKVERPYDGPINLIDVDLSVKTKKPVAKVAA